MYGKRIDNIEPYLTKSFERIPNALPMVRINIYFSSSASYKMNFIDDIFS